MENKKKQIIWSVAIILAVIALPIAYSLFYLGAFWDPYSKLDKVPVAVVNNDQGAKIGGETRNIGKELTDRLKENDQLKWVFTDDETAASGLENMDYYAVIIIPEDFSKDIASAETTDKTAPSIIYSSNEKTNFLATQIINQAVLKLESQIKSDISKQITGTLKDKITEVPDSLKELDNGLGKLKNGSEKLENGADQLENGISQLTNGAKQLENGLGELSDGQSSLTGGSEKLAKGTDSLSSGVSDLSAGISKLQKGAAQTGEGADTLLKEINKSLPALYSGIKSLDTGAKNLQSGTKAYVDGVNQLIKSNAELTQNIAAVLASTQLDDAHKVAAISQILSVASSADNQNKLNLLSQSGTQLTQGASQLAEGVKEFSSKASGLDAIPNGVKKLSTAIKKLDSGAKQLKNGSGKLQKGVNKLQKGANSLKNGSDKLYNGSKSAHDASGQLVAGAGKIQSASGQLAKGAGTLTSGITKAKNGVNDSYVSAKNQIKKLDGIEDYTKEPVTVEEAHTHNVANYGTAFAPYFMSLSLYVGALIMFVGIYLDMDEKIKVLSRNSKHRYIRVAIFALIGIAQALVLAFVVHRVLGLEIVNMPMYYLSCILVSIVFISIVEFFMVIMQDTGKFLAMLLLILQLTSCGGTFPMETVPKFFQVLYPFMPMTYSVKLFKEAISGYDSGLALKATLVLLLFFAIFTGLTVLFSARKNGRFQFSFNRSKKTEDSVNA